MRYKKKFIALDNFTINHNFQIFVEKINKRQTGPNWRENTGVMGSCALQAFEIYYQMFHNQNGFKSVKCHFIEKEGFLDENFKDKHEYLAFQMRSYVPFNVLFSKMYDYRFLRARFLKTSNLRALLEREEFLKVPILCNIRDKVEGHINILYRDERGLFVINTNERSKNKIKLIEPHNGDIFALEEIAYNWTGEFELVREFRLYIPYELVEFKENIEESEEEEEFNEELEEELEKELEEKELANEKPKSTKQDEGVFGMPTLIFAILYVMVVAGLLGLVRSLAYN
ncbi:hypothetical protein ABV837_000608 [Campylobacter upsaliensis]|uniref:hypothetical protein n=1 Tax=Campylobacter upsaliensis TaxID=28080 RepID=UPI00127D9DD6|nr:hypothetical protein [Campylobacter upsaliensis]EAH7701925.1 hypothetical protein [Campylobacter upsaliensis]EAJ2281631.1 hypothetical protein [Campylobacter upsaliensis]EAJ7130755.1 hypothetical protein [Campylobacter upsaliensis]EAJ7265272.1 hypothetical protein [Campylobacter upsaliensis]EAJ7396584.1 hypothetical protein [Campylobacter upsaliensis]